MHTELFIDHLFQYASFFIPVYSLEGRGLTELTIYVRFLFSIALISLNSTSFRDISSHLSSLNHRYRFLMQLIYTVQTITIDNVEVGLSNKLIYNENLRIVGE